jgi:hypothetical protein
MVKKTKEPAKRKARIKNVPLAEEVNSGQSNFVLWKGLLGWIVGILAIFGFIALGSDFSNEGEQNFLGPYLGSWYAIELKRLLGKLPSVLVLLGSIAASLGLIGFKHKLLNVRNSIFYVLSVLWVFCLLSLRTMGSTPDNIAFFENTGGVLGTLTVAFVWEPIFAGQAGGAFAVIWSAVVITLIWGLRLDVAELFRELRNLILRKKQSIVASSLMTKNSGGMSHYQTPLVNGKPLEQGQASENEYLEKPSNTVRLLDIPEPPDTNDPVALRRWRDDMARRERDKGVNEWEDRRGDNEMKIAGLLEKKMNEESASNPQNFETPRTYNKFGNEELKPEPETTSFVTRKIGMEKDKTLEVLAVGVNETDSPMSNGMNALKPYVIPKMSDVFGDVPEQEIDFTEEELREQGFDLEAKLSNFGVKGKVVHITTGPVITRFEIDLAPGVKVAKISGLAEDLALALRSKSVRILAPIPGKSAVGVETPNKSMHVVYCKEILESDTFRNIKAGIPIALGKDISGESFVTDLAKAPHLLIAGQTGSGKSVCINMLMSSILASKTPEELRMILVDPKVVELKPYEEIPHLLAPVITQPDVAVQALHWCCWEMDRRYEVLAKAKVRNIAGFNERFKKNMLVDLVDADDNCIMPFLVIVIDELADLMMVAGKEVETSIARIAQKARAVGIHLVLATQRPSINVITGVIKANLPTRIAFRVASQIDARTIMDKAGAEKLLGRGDMLFKSMESPDPERVHGAFITDEEVEIYCEASSGQDVNFPRLSSFDVEEAGGEIASELGPRDIKFPAAAELVVALGTASASLLQRRMQLGYARAGRLIDQLEAAGIVGGERGSKGRHVLMNEDELKSFLSGDPGNIPLD